MKIDLVEKELSGGKISIESIKRNLAPHEKIDLKISGLRQNTLEFLIKNYSNQINKVNFFKCPRLEDLSPLEELVKTSEIIIWWNQQAPNFWDVSKNKTLKLLHLIDFKKTSNLESISTSQTVEELELDGGMWSKNTYETLDPLVNMLKLRILVFGAKLKDNRIEPISQIQNLEEILFPSNLFKTEQIAWLKARLSADIKSDILMPFEIYSADPTTEEIIEVLIHGKRKPFDNIQENPQKFENYVNKFNSLYQYYLKNPKENEPI